MYQIRSATGEETEYETAEEFAAAVRDGRIGPDALIHHARTDRWILVCLNPEYQQARNDVRPVATLEAPPLVEETPFWQQPVKIRSPKITPVEADAPLWQHRLLRWGTVVAGVVILSGIGVTVWWRIGGRAGLEPPVPLTSHVVAVPSADAAPAPVALSDTAASPAPTEVAFRAPDSTAYWTQPASGVEAAPSATGTLRRLSLDQAIDGLAARMHGDLTSIGFYRLLSPGEITIPEKLWHGKRTLQDAQNIFEAYRVQVRQTGEEIRQLAAAERGRTAAPPSRDEAGVPTGRMVETYEMEQVADTLVDEIGKVLQFLLERQSSYNTAGGRLDFDHPEDAAAYRALRGRCQKLVSEDALVRRPGRHSIAPPMMAILTALDSLPEPTER